MVIRAHFARNEIDRHRLVFVVAMGLRPVHSESLQNDRPQGIGYSKHRSKARYPLDEICFVILTASSSAAVA